jgi:tight adherence protein C
MAILLAAFVGLSVILIFVGLSSSSGPTLEQERLETFGSRPRTLQEMEMSQPFSERVVAPWIRGMSGFMGRFAPQRNLAEMRRKLDLAGNPNNWAPADFLGVRGLSSVITAAFLTLMAFLMTAPVLQQVLFLLVGAILGFYLPMFWLNAKISRRQYEIQRALPDALDLLTISVEAGLGFDAAMAKVTEKSENELSRAFGRVISEIRLGKLRREALRDMANRADVQDLSNFIAAVLQADQLGVSLTKVLRIQSEQMRIRRRQRAEELAGQAPVKMMFPLAFLIFPSIFIVLLGPAVLLFMTGNAFGGGR